MQAILIAADQSDADEQTPAITQAGYEIAALITPSAPIVPIGTVAGVVVSTPAATALDDYKSLFAAANTAVLQAIPEG